MRPYFTGFQSDRESVDPPNIISPLLVVQPEEEGMERGNGEKGWERVREGK
jgi:hypothetical protein